MPHKTSAELVIDACVARASGKENATSPTSKNCRDFLLAVLGNGHRLVMTPEITAEWKTHESSFARNWRKTMVAKKKLTAVRVGQNGQIRSRIAACCSNKRVVSALLKDMLLIEAAWATGDSVTSIDEEARLHFNNTAWTVTELRSIAWVNPDREDEAPITWLGNGAPLDPHRLLGYAHPGAE
jgi:hypothetical protein